MNIQITALSESNPSVNMLVYGDSGAGKTVLGGTAPRALILAVEAGTISAARQGSKAHVVDCSTYPKFAAVLNAARAGTLRHPDGEKFSWLVVDSLTMFQEKLQTDVIEKAHASNPNRSATILDMMGHQEFQRLYKRVVNALNDLDENVLYLCHAMRKTDEELDPIILPHLTGKFGTDDSTACARWTVGTMDIYGYLAVSKKAKAEGEPERRRLIVERRDAYFGKDRLNLFGGHIDQPNMAEIHSAIFGA
ncbi:MAG: AAA family ATPase [Bacillota bacterium]